MCRDRSWSDRAGLFFDNFQKPCQSLLDVLGIDLTPLVFINSLGNNNQDFSNPPHPLGHFYGDVSYVLVRYVPVTLFPDVFTSPYVSSLKKSQPIELHLPMDRLGI